MKGKQELLAMSREEKISYIQYLHERGPELGFIEYIREEASIEYIKKMALEGLSIEIIARISGYSIQGTEEILNKNE